MSTITLELRKVLKIQGFKLFDFDYQFDDLAFKAKLEQYIIDYFYDYEITGESIEQFKRISLNT